MRKNALTKDIMRTYLRTEGFSRMGSSRRLIADLEKAGFVLDRISGSHHIFVKQGFPLISVPHPRADLGKGIESKLRKAARV